MSENNSVNKKDFHHKIEDVLNTYKKEKEKSLYVTISWSVVGFLFLIFILSIWNSAPEILKIFLLIIGTIISYIFGIKYQEQKIRVYGTFIVLGYVLFGISIFQLKHMLHVPVFTVSSYILWGIIGLFLILLTKNQYLVLIMLVVVNLGQIQLVASDSFSYIIFFFILCISFYLVRQQNKLGMTFLISISAAIELVYLGFEIELNYAFFPIVLIILYILNEQTILEKSANVLKIVILLNAYLQNVLFIIFSNWFIFITDLSWKKTLILMLIFSIMSFFLLFIQQGKKEHNFSDILLFLPLFLLGRYGAYVGLIIITYYTFLLVRKKIFIQSLKTIHVYMVVFIPILIITKITWSFINKPFYFLIVAIIILLAALNIDEIKSKIKSYFIKENNSWREDKEL